MLTSVRALQLFQVMRFGAFFLTGILFTKLGLGAYGIGIYESLLFLGSLLSFFWLSGLTQSLLAHFRPAPRSTEFFNAFLVMAGCSVLVFVLFRLLITPFSFLANNPEVLWHYGTFSWYVLLMGPVFLGGVHPVAQGPTEGTGGLRGLRLRHAARICDTTHLMWAMG
jgi:hypothetical protein